VTEDEAFIRAVVDSPGDDTPRLVYADWLDDHDDPRGPYLRAEHAWRKPWRVDEWPTERLQLRAMAVGLDPVWVARISRPPVGVCCEHLQFAHRGPQLTIDELAEVDHWPRVRFPDDYTAFLLNYNGGIPHLPDYSPAMLGNTEFTLGELFSFHPKDNLRAHRTLHRKVHCYWNERLPPFLETKPPDYEDDIVTWYHDFIPIGEVDGDRVSLMLGIYGEYCGRLQLINWTWLPGGFIDDESDQLGGSFAGLLSRTAPYTSE
jgi:uncharacterized protein (TIGR02996 family)